LESVFDPHKTLLRAGQLTLRAARNNGNGPALRNCGEKAQERRRGQKIKNSHNVKLKDRKLVWRGQIDAAKMISDNVDALQWLRPVVRNVHSAREKDCDCKSKAADGERGLKNEHAYVLVERAVARRRAHGAALAAGATVVDLGGEEKKR